MKALSGNNTSSAAELGGTVLLVAPLMGTEPDNDALHAQWLHVHVRPPVRALLKVRSLSPQQDKDAYCDKIGMV